MACKRTATTDLNHENWNQEEAPEEAGTFVKASAEVLEKRVLKTAKRRTISGEDSRKSAFSSFSGFKTSGNTNATSQFSFLSKMNFNSPNTTNGSQSSAENGTRAAKTTAAPIFSNESMLKSPQTEQTSEKSPKKSLTYYSKLKGLNEGVSQWIKKHVDTNPYCILTPIFKDYEKYLKDIESFKETDQTEKAGETNENKKCQASSTESSVKSSETPTIFSDAKATLNSADFRKPESSIFSNATSGIKSIFSNVEQNKSDNLFTSADSESNPFFKKSNTTTEEDGAAKSDTSSTGVFSVAAVNPATFSFGQSSAVTASAGFSFGGGKPFTFGAQASKTTDSSEKTDEEEKNEDDEPPKPNFQPVKEEGSIYEQRCKVYVKKDGQFGDRGVGTLFLKPAPNEKMQLIVRAANSLGNILLNTLLTSSIPIKRLKPNCIMLVCVPMPQGEPQPTSVLLQVKSKEEGDTLMKELENNAK